MIGYMLMHTRQLGMIMHNESMVAHYKEKILSDLVTVVGAPGRELPACPTRAAEEVETTV